MAEKIRVLYVDDERPLLGICKKFLERNGNFTVFTAESAREALVLVREQHIDVIISDYQMPVMGGIDFLKAVRNTDPDIPFVFFSGKGTKETIIEAFRHGADRYIEKRGEPEFLFEDLQHIVTEIVTLKNAGRALHESEKLFREVFNNANDAMFLHEMTPEGPGKYIRVNEVAIRWLGYTRDELLTMSVHDIVPEPVFSGVVPETTKSLFKNGQATFESVHKRKDGSTYPVEVSTHIFMLNNRQLSLSIARDITERKRADEAIQKSRETYRELVESISDVIFEMDGNGKITYISPGVNNVLEFEPEEIIGKNFIEFIYHEDRPLLIKRFSELSEAIEHPLDYRVTTKSGGIRWVRTRTKPVIREKTFCGARGTLIDITERKRAERLLGDIIAQNPMSIQIVDKDGFTISVNSAHASLFGAVPPSDFSIFNDLQLKQQGFGELIDRIKTGEVVTFPVTYYNVHDSIPECPDVPVWVHTVVFPLNDDYGKPEQFVLMHENITDRKRAEDALRASEEKFRSLVEHALYGILILDLQGTILFANNAMARTLEVGNCAVLIGRNVMEFVAPESREDVVKDFIEVSHGHDAYLAHYNVISAKGNKFYLESIGKVIKYEGKPADLVSIRDITDRKRAEDALRASEQMYRDVVEDQTEFICRFLPDGKLTFINEAYCSYFRLNREECIGKRHSVLLPPEDAEQMKNHLASLTPENPVLHDFRAKLNLLQF